MAPKRKPASLPVEIEAKIRVASFAAIKRRLRAAGGRLLTARSLETNTLFDFADRSLMATGRSFRVRRYGSTGLVTFKGLARIEGGLKSRLELETEVASPEVLAEILKSLGLVPVFRYEKFREVWALLSTEICLDETPIGRFVEIEGRAVAIRRVAALLGLTDHEFVTASYPALWAASGRPGDMAFPVTARTRRDRS